MGAEVKASHAEEMAVHLKTFQEQLEAFAATHKKKIQTDPQFRAQFNRMCREVGVDPLQCASLAARSQFCVAVCRLTGTSCAREQREKASGRPRLGMATSTMSLEPNALKFASAPARRTGYIPCIYP